MQSHLGLASPLAAEVQQLDRPGHQPIDIVVEERLDLPGVARQAGPAEILDVITGENLGHRCQTAMRSPLSKPSGMSDSAIGWPIIWSRNCRNCAWCDS